MLIILPTVLTSLNLGPTKFVRLMFYNHPVESIAFFLSLLAQFRPTLFHICFRKQIAIHELRFTFVRPSGTCWWFFSRFNFYLDAIKLLLLLLFVYFVDRINLARLNRSQFCSARVERVTTDLGVPMT